mmetsp:Transcript_34527/g.83336  ORF Transcript_34527/g.83336 Transcript_34527/m.83336 type:complete len:159 (-) Transcript_34527:4245-4721(-)
MQSMYFLRVHQNVRKSSTVVGMLVQIFVPGATEIINATKFVCENSSVVTNASENATMAIVLRVTNNALFVVFIRVVPKIANRFVLRASRPVIGSANIKAVASWYAVLLVVDFHVARDAQNFFHVVTVALQFVEKSALTNLIVNNAVQTTRGMLWSIIS